MRKADPERTMQDKEAESKRCEPFFGGQSVQLAYHFAGFVWYPRLDLNTDQDNMVPTLPIGMISCNGGPNCNVCQVPKSQVCGNGKGLSYGPADCARLCNNLTGCTDCAGCTGCTGFVYVAANGGCCYLRTGTSPVLTNYGSAGDAYVSQRQVQENDETVAFVSFLSTNNSRIWLR